MKAAPKVGEPPLISIVTVVLNGAKTLERAIESVTKQRFADLEYFVQDGGSTDGSLDILRRHEARVRWRSEPDEGLYDAMNKAVRVIRGRWVLFLGADDVLTADLHQIAGLLKDERTVYYGDVYMPRRNVVYDGPFNAYKIMFRNICQQAIFYPRAVFATRAFDMRYRLWADHALNMSLFGDERFRFCYIDKQVCVFNDETGASSHMEDARFKADREVLIRTHLPAWLFVAYRLRTAASTLKHWVSQLPGRT